jgi:hypothetical protein
MGHAKWQALFLTFFCKVSISFYEQLLAGAAGIGMP